VFHSTAVALNPGGLFIFDVNTASGLSTRWGTRDRVFTDRADVFEVNQSNFDERSAVNTTVTTIFVREPDRQLFRRYTEIHRERAYSMAVLNRLLHEAGLLVERTYGVPDSLDGVPQKIAPDRDDAARVIIAARRAIDA
jgi:hypothetical protein